MFVPETKIKHPRVIHNTYIPRRKGVQPGKSTRPVSLINLKPGNFYLKLSEMERREKESIRPVPSPRNRSPPTVSLHGVNLSSDTAMDFHITDMLDYDRKVQLLKDKEDVNQLFKRQMNDQKYKYVIRNYRLVKVPRQADAPVADPNRSLGPFPSGQRSTMLPPEESAPLPVENSIINPKKYHLSTKMTDYSVIEMMDSTLNPTRP